jgi:diphosphomevalonate decarboxylase
LGNKPFVPQREKGLAFAPTNIALCKYWGKRDTELNLPVTSSLSISLTDKGAMTTIVPRDAEADLVVLNGNELPADSSFVRRLVAYLDLFREQKKWSLDIDINMTVPVAAGLASSACGFASMVAALNDLFNWQLPMRDLSILARLGSGSASRSFWPGFVEWHAGSSPDGMDSFAEPLEYEMPSLCVGILTLDEAQKPISSRDAMQRTVNSSVLYNSWPKKVSQDMTILKQAMKLNKFPLLGGTAESNALAMHATMLSSWPPVCYYLPETISMMQKIWKLREEGLDVYFTQDAGPNLKLLYLEKDVLTVRSHFPGIESINVF